MGLRGILRVLRISNLLNALLVVVLLPIVTLINLGSASVSDIDGLFLLFYSTSARRARMGPRRRPQPALPNAAALSASCSAVSR